MMLLAKNGKRTERVLLSWLRTVEQTLVSPEPEAFGNGG